MAARSKARKRALDVLFEADLRELPVLELLTERMSLGEQPTPEYAAQIVRGVAAHRAEIDKLLAGNAVGWTLDRMPAVDRNVLRIGVWELRWAGDVPAGVAISEAVELVQDLSTDGSPAFVNGLLAKIAAIQADEPAVQEAAAEPAAGPEAGADPETGRPEAEAGPEAEASPEHEVGPEAEAGTDAEAGTEADAGAAAALRPARPHARSANLIRPKISSVLRPAAGPAQSPGESED